MSHPHKSTTHEEKYFHIRDRDDGGSDGTVFFRKEGEQWYGSAALCHEKDNFCRRTGRSIARRKYFQGKKFEVEVPDTDTAYEVMYAAMGNMYGETN